MPPDQFPTEGGVLVASLHVWKVKAREIVLFKENAFH